MGVEAAHGGPTAGALRLVVADDRPVMRAGLTALLQPIGVVADVAIDDLVEASAATEASLAVVGVRDDDAVAFQAIARATARCPALSILVVANSASVIELREAVIAGVDSFLLATTTAADLHDAVERTAAGERVIAPSIAMQLASTWSAEASRTGAADVTDREAAVLRLLAEGRTNDQIADELRLASRTVKTHVQNILSKLDAPDRTAAVARALRLGLIS